MQTSIGLEIVFIWHYHISDVFRLVLNHHEGDKHKEPYIWLLIYLPDNG